MSLFSIKSLSKCQERRIFCHILCVQIDTITCAHKNDCNPHAWSFSVCVSECVCYQLINCCTPGLNGENKVLLGLLWHFQDIHRVDFVENAL